MAIGALAFGLALKSLSFKNLVDIPYSLLESRPALSSGIGHGRSFGCCALTLQLRLPNLFEFEKVGGIAIAKDLGVPGMNPKRPRGEALVQQVGGF